MKILLHTCCAPCLIYPLERLRKEGLGVEGFFYNPNIYPLDEYKNRQQAVMMLSRSAGVEVIYPEYAPEEFSRAVSLRETDPGRCAICWRLRLKQAACLAKEKGFDYFTTTLLVSPYQDQGLLKEIGSDVSHEAGVNFYYEDFRPGFREAHNLAKKQGIYCQKYCGCRYSMKPRLTEQAPGFNGTAGVPPVRQANVSLTVDFKDVG